MTIAEERIKTIEYLRRFVFLMEDRHDADDLKGPIDRLKAEIKKLEEASDL